MDALGRTPPTFRSNGTTNTLDVSSLTPGIYILRLTTDQAAQTETKRFVKN